MKAEGARARRRPGREQPEASNADVEVVDVESGEELHQAHTKTEKTEHKTEGGAGDELNAQSEAGDEKKIEIKFFGSELLRAKYPKYFDLAETVATDWMNNGNFDHLPIRQPLVQYAAQKGLQRAKEVEKKVLESPITEKVAMQVLTAGMKAQGLIEQVRTRLKKD